MDLGPRTESFKHCSSPKSSISRASINRKGCWHLSGRCFCDVFCFLLLFWKPSLKKMGCFRRVLPEVPHSTVATPCGPKVPSNFEGFSLKKLPAGRKLADHPTPNFSPKRPLLKTSDRPSRLPDSQRDTFQSEDHRVLGWEELITSHHPLLTHLP